MMDQAKMENTPRMTMMTLASHVACVQTYVIEKPDSPLLMAASRGIPDPILDNTKANVIKTHPCNRTTALSINEALKDGQKDLLISAQVVHRAESVRQAQTTPLMCV